MNHEIIFENNVINNKVNIIMQRIREFRQQEVITFHHIDVLFNERSYKFAINAKQEGYVKSYLDKTYYRL